jgi:hypothetical protein
MFPEALEKLIAATLVDGKITDKERMVLVKKAASLGIDQDEFEVLLDARIHEAGGTAAMEATMPLHQASGRVGEIRKCPACGATVPGLTARCGECDHEFTSVAASSSVQALLRRLESLQDKNFFEDLLAGGNTAIKDRSKIIKNFPIPNSREAVLEFLAMGMPRTKLVGGFLDRHLNRNGETEEGLHNALTTAWIAKCSEVIHKGRVIFRDDPSTLAQLNAFAKELGI